MKNRIATNNELNVIEASPTNERAIGSAAAYARKPTPIWHKPQLKHTFALALLIK